MTDTTHDDLVKVTVSDGKYTFGQREDGSCYALRYGEPWREDIFDALTLAMAQRIAELEAKLASCEKYRDAYAECDRIAAQAVRDLEAKLAKAVEALRFYADPTYNGYDVCVGDYGLSLTTGCIIKDDGDLARTTLAELKGQNNGE